MYWNSFSSIKYYANIMLIVICTLAVTSLSINQIITDSHLHTSAVAYFMLIYLIFCKQLQELQVQINSEDMTELQIFLETYSFLPTETLS